MFHFISFAFLYSVAYCANVVTDCGSKTAWTNYKSCMSSMFLQADSAPLGQCYTQSQCPDPTTGSIYNNPIFDGGCQNYQKAGYTLNCTLFYICANQTGTQIATDSLPCIQNYSPKKGSYPYKSFTFPMINLFELEFCFGNYDLSGTCNTTVLTQCMNTVNCVNSTLQNDFCNNAKYCVSSNFPNCNETGLAQQLCYCLNKQYSDFNIIFNYGPKFQNCMGSNFTAVDTNKLIASVRNGISTTCYYYPTFTCGIS